MTRGQCRWLVSAVVVAAIAAVPVASAAAASARAARPTVQVPLVKGGGVSQIAEGHATGCEVLATSRVRCWGSGSYGQLGDGTTHSSLTPVRVRRLTGATQVATGYGHSCALLRSGSVRCWGWNYAGQLGDGSLADSSLPVVVRGVSHATAISVGFAHSCARVANGTVRCWGWNTYGQLGDGTTDARSVAHPVRGLRDVVSIATGYADTCALLESGRVACWGINQSGQLGNGTQASSTRPMPVQDLSHVHAIALGFGSGCAVLETGRVSCWGRDNYGQLGDGATKMRLRPVGVRGLGHATQVAIGYGHACALLRNHTVRCWGWNGHGQLGTSTTTRHLVPVPARPLKGAIDVVAGDDTTCVLLAVLLYTCWGLNGQGELGDGVSSSLLRPSYLPSAPLGVQVTPQPGAITASWQAPSDPGIRKVTGYLVVASDASRRQDPSSCEWRSGPLQCTVDGLTNGDSYRVQVTARNIGGLGFSSPSSSPVIPATVPGAPLDVTAVAGNGSALVSWAPPSSDGGLPVASYRVTAHDLTTAARGGETCAWVSGPLTCTVSGLTNGDRYTFSVAASNGVGSGLDSGGSSAVMPRSVPGAPTAVTAVAGNGSATVTWTAPSATGGSAITGYTVSGVDQTTHAATGTVCAWTHGPLGCTAESLSNGDLYTFTVTATNGVGTSLPSAPSSAVIPATTPGAPRDVTAVSGDASATVAWVAPTSNGGRAITSYAVAATDQTTSATIESACTWTSGPLTCTAHGLMNGDPYAFTVRATNAVGSGSASSPSLAVTPATTPDAPTGVAAAPGNGSATVTWTAPASDGGSPITGYTVDGTDQTTSTDVGTCVWSGGPLVCTYLGLTNGDSYTFTVRAMNAVGAGLASAASSPVTPATTPGAPTGVAATPGDGSATVTWTAPASDGGSPITGYTVDATDQTSSTDLGTLCTWASGPLTCTASSLTNGDSYSFTVTAVNSVGAGAASDPSTAVTPATTPGAPTAVLATPLVASATITWSAPPSDGGSPITSYTVDATDQSSSTDLGTVCTWTSGPLTCTAPTLTTGDGYTFTVTAVNAVGPGVASAPSNEIVVL